jgi:hypothetical protein
MKLADLMKQGDELLDSRLFPEQPDWESLYAETPDDAMPDEGPNEDEEVDEEVDALNSSDLPARIDALRNALAADLQPLGEALYAAYQAGDLAATTAALRKISANLPDYLESRAMEALISRELLTALSES